MLDKLEQIKERYDLVIAELSDPTAFANQKKFKTLSQERKHLEPIMDIEATSPEEFMGSVLGDLNQRRAKIVNLGSRGNLKTTRCDVPLAEMFNYVNALRSLTQGRASFSMEPSYYDQVPTYIADKIIGARQEPVTSKKS